MRLAIAFATVFVLLASGCEARAQHEGGVSPDRLSAAGEACAATSDCAEALRCVDRVCMTVKRSDVGDYHLAAGELALDAKNIEKAVAELRLAEAEYKRVGGEATADVNCLLGEALAHQRADPLKGEEAAAKLHRCIKALVAGSARRHRALRAMARLADVGFDAASLAGTGVADRYLTRAPSKPKSENLTVTAVAARKSSKKTFIDWMGLLGGAEVKAALTPCWVSYWDATKQKELVLGLPFRYAFRLDPDDEERDRGVLSVHEPTTPGDAALAAAQTCVIEALAPIGAEMARRGGEHSWSSKITLTIKP